MRRRARVCGGGLLAALLWGLPPFAPHARAEAGGAGQTCAPAVDAAERAERLPSLLLSAVALVESGRRDPATGAVLAWPWTINAEGRGYHFSTKAEAVAAVKALQASGVASVDVGCLQVNLLHHPGAFASVEQAFDPAANAAYGARYLGRLYGETNAWSKAISAYHSRTPDIGDAYARRVLALWPLSGRFAATPPPAAPLGNRTPEFAARLAQDEKDRAARLAAMRFGPAPAARGLVLAEASSGRPRARRQRS